MWFSVQKPTRLINAILDALPLTLCVGALAGSILYAIRGWDTLSAIVTTLTAIASGFALKPEELSTQKTSAHISVALITSLIIGTIAWHLTRFTDMINPSIWSFTSSKFVVLTILLITALVFGLFYNKINQATRWIMTLVVLGINSYVYAGGFGFDVFVHEATLRAWMTNGSVTPYSPLYSGFYALIGILSISAPTIIGAIQWTTPIIGATILTRIHPFYTITTLLIFSSLFVSTTPQALGHILLIFFTIILTSQTHSRKTILSNLLYVGGITAIHPLSGIPAFILFILTHIRHTIATWVLACVSILIPVTALLYGSHGTYTISHITLSPLATFLKILPVPAFQPYTGALLAHYAAPISIFGMLALGFLGLRTSQKPLLMRFSLVSLVLLISAILTTGITTPNIIAYEQFAFAERLLLASCITFIPVATQGLLYIWDMSSRKTRLIIAVCAMLLIYGQWYSSFPSWNSITQTKARNTTQLDHALVKRIDADAQGKPYIVLADQPTSAAALHAFGFTSRALPTRPEFFYPIPTGDELYTKFFIPAMHTDISRAELDVIFSSYNVEVVYIVAKPYWISTPEQTHYLQSISDAVITLDETYIYKLVHHTVY